MSSPWSFPAATCSSLSISTSEKTAQMGPSIDNGLNYPSKLPVLNAPADTVSNLHKIKAILECISMRRSSQSTKRAGAVMHDGNHSFHFWLFIA